MKKIENFKALNSINGEWEDYKKHVIPEAAHEIQKQEMQKSFYMGAWSVMSILAKLVDENMTEDAGAEIFEGMRQECLAFFKTL